MRTPRHAVIVGGTASLALVVAVVGGTLSAPVEQAAPVTAHVPQVAPTWTPAPQEVPDVDLEARDTTGASRSGDRGDVPAVAIKAPADAESAQDFGSTGFTGHTPEPEPVVQAAPALEPAPVEQVPPAPEPAPQPEPEPVAQAAPALEPAPVEQAQPRSEPEPVRQPAPQPQPEPAPQPQPEPEPAPQPAPTGGVLDVAAAYTGIMYLYGGTTPAGFDCSGYTSFVFRLALGIELPRTAAGQQAWATPVSDPQPGDLVFFGYPAYHVGIYAGDGMMYDSGRPGLPTQLRAIFGGVSGYGRVG